jgi:hypothetical protein
VSPLSLFHPSAPNGHSAILSPCRAYRYALERRWGSGPFVLFVGLNPSTADESEDDNTIRRCIGFAKGWGYGGLLMGNLYAYRATQPRDLAKAADPVGPDNDTWLTTMSCRSGLIIAAWGADKMVLAREQHALEALGDGVCCLRKTKAGHPEHPLYLPKTLRPVPFGAKAAA